MKCQEIMSPLALSLGKDSLVMYIEEPLNPRYSNTMLS